MSPLYLMDGTQVHYDYMDEWIPTCDALGLQTCSEHPVETCKNCHKPVWQRVMSRPEYDTLVAEYAAAHPNNDGTEP